jgi:hypothetical protein
VTEQIAEDLAEWRFHRRAWADFFTRRAEFDSYSDYLLTAGRPDLT